MIGHYWKMKISPVYWTEQVDCLTENIENAKGNIEMDVALTKEIVKRRTDMEVDFTDRRYSKASVPITLQTSV